MKDKKEVEELAKKAIEVLKISNIKNPYLELNKYGYATGKIIENPTN